MKTLEVMSSEELDLIVDEAMRWIDAHGSTNLRRTKSEGLDYSLAYIRERVSKELPGWEPCEVGKRCIFDAKSPPPKAFQLLDQARELIEDAKLIKVEHVQACRFHVTSYPCYVASAMYNHFPVYYKKLRTNLLCFNFSEVIF